AARGVRLRRVRGVARPPGRRRLVLRDRGPHADGRHRRDGLRARPSPTPARATHVLRDRGRDVLRGGADPGLVSARRPVQNRAVAATYVHLFTDLSGYSRMFAELGERGIIKVLGPYERIVRAALPRRTVEADHIGDGFHLVFPTASEAVATAIKIADAL